MIMNVLEEEEPLPLSSSLSLSSSSTPLWKKDLVFLFILLVGITLIVVIFPLNVYLFSLVYLFAILFPPTPPDTNMAAAASL